ncbi:hypothetical protein H5T51_09670 [Candidatus Bathyarchaeota archaeon]|nr:hypothetical protein [Candidatus Bathyarchaeota archaeon]
MPEKKDSSRSTGMDIFQMLMETSEKERRKRREEFLAPLGVKEFFEEGDISIDKRTCLGVECKLCIKACPTNALFWKSGEVGIIKELCIYCGACVLSCMVDYCIRIKRKRADGKIEAFGTPREFILLQESINAEKRLKRAKTLPQP